MGDDRDVSGCALAERELVFAADCGETWVLHCQDEFVYGW